MEISESEADLKLARWKRDSLNVLAQVRIGAFSVSVSGAKVFGSQADRLVLKLPTGTMQIPLPEETKFESETVEHDSLTINFSKNGSCYLQATPVPDPEWPNEIGHK